MFCGTLGAIGGIRPASRFEMELEDPVLGRTLRHAYAIDVLPVVSLTMGCNLKPLRRSVLSRQKATKAERSSAPRRGDAASPKPALPLTVTRPELLNDGTDRDFRRLVHNIFAFMARHEAIRDGHARQIGLAGVEYTILISIGHLGLDSDVNVKTVADHLHMSGAFITTVTSKLQGLGLVEKTQDSVDRRRISLAITEKGKALLRKLAPYQSRDQRRRIRLAQPR